MYRKFAKRFFDVVFSLVGLLATSPVLAASAVVLACANRGTPLFLQSRPGLNGRIFRIVKLRTMNSRRDLSGKLLPDSERTHRAGRFIRSLSIDELPQMVNVLKGDMSFIGPRPLLPEYLPFYDAVQARRHEVRPGMTGWAQVNGRNAISWEEKFAYDVWYVDHIGPGLDLRIAWLTVKRVLSRKDINAGGEVPGIRFDTYCRQRAMPHAR